MKNLLFNSCLFLSTFILSCKVYSFNDATIPSNIKTVKVLTVENRAGYINPNFAPQLTTSIQQNIISKTKLTGVKAAGNADYMIKTIITEYNPTITSGIGSSGSNQNQLKITVEVNLTNTQTNEEQNFEITRNWNYDYSTPFSQVESTLLPEILKSFSDDIFNKIFSNW